MPYSHAGEDRLVGLGGLLFINLEVGSLSAGQWQPKSHHFVVLAELPPVVAEGSLQQGRASLDIQTPCNCLCKSHFPSFKWPKLVTQPSTKLEREGINQGRDVEM